MEAVRGTVTIRDAEEFVRLRESDVPADYRRASSEDAPVDVWLEVVRSYPHMRFWVAQNKTVPPAVLAVLLADPDARVRAMVARKRSLDPLSLMKLAEDEDETVRAAVARNPATSDATLRQLANDQWDEVREIVADRLQGEEDRLE